MKQLAIFDLDGTLLNTITDLGAAVNHALESVGLPPHPLGAYNYMVGNGVRKLIERAVPEVDPALRNRILDAFLEYYISHCTVHTRPYPGIPEVLAELTDRGVKIAVASNKYQEAVDKVVRHYFPDIPFIALAGQVEGRPVKPDPSIVFSILNKEPVPKREILFIGDSAVDIETARRACVESLGVTWGFRPVSELRQAGASHIISRPEEILKHLSDPF